MLCLRHKIQRNPVGIDGPIRNHKDLGGACNHIDTHFTEDLSLSFSNVTITRAYNFIDGSNGFRAVSQRCDRLRSTYSHHLIDTGQ